MRRVSDEVATPPSTVAKWIVSHGLVTLFGSVSCWQDALEAEEAVSDSHGVEEVVDELVVRGRTRQDIISRAGG
jgi:osmotically-inducible protein OsmY